jgi:hypothetical protein
LINNLQISEFQDDFSVAIDVPSTLYVAQYEVWVALFNTAVLQSGKTYFMRYTINDGDNPTNTTYPNNQTSFVYKNMWSFTVQ